MSQLVPLCQVTCVTSKLQWRRNARFVQNCKNENIHITYARVGYFSRASCFKSSWRVYRDNNRLFQQGVSENWAWHCQLSLRFLCAQSYQCVLQPFIPKNPLGFYLVSFQYNSRSNFKFLFSSKGIHVALINFGSRCCNGMLLDVLICLILKQIGEIFHLISIDYNFGDNEHIYF